MILYDKYSINIISYHIILITFTGRVLLANDIYLNYRTPLFECVIILQVINKIIKNVREKTSDSKINNNNSK